MRQLPQERELLLPPVLHVGLASQAKIPKAFSCWGIRSICFLLHNAWLSHVSDMCSIEIVRSKAAVSENSCRTSAGPFARRQRRGVTNYLAVSDAWAPAKVWLHATVCNAQLAKKMMNGDGTTLSLMLCQQAPPAPKDFSSPANGNIGKLVLGIALIFFAVFVPSYHQGATPILIQAPFLRATRCGRHITKRFRATLGRFGGFHHFCPALLQEESSNAPTSSQ